MGTRVLNRGLSETYHCFEDLPPVCLCGFRNDASAEGRDPGATGTAAFFYGCEMV
jgi:hypothetical protein